MMHEQTACPRPWAVAMSGIALALLVPSVALGGATGTMDPLGLHAVAIREASKASLLAVARAGDRLVAAGERGVVLLSDDQGLSWKQADVPVSVTLTALSFPTPSHGWAVGHGGTILVTVDAGSTWRKQADGRKLASLTLKAAQERRPQELTRIAAAELLVKDGPDKPLLAVHFFDDKRGIAVGAYGLAFGTEDGGQSWAPWQDRLDNPKGLHLNAIRAERDRIFLAGEQGLLLRSSNAGKSFERLESPYTGSWFALTGTDSVLVVAGLRGNVYWSDDHGNRFQKSAVPDPVSFSAATTGRNGALLFVNQAGALLTSADGGRTLKRQMFASQAPLTSVLVLPDGTAIATTFSGVARAALPSR